MRLREGRARPTIEVTQEIIDQAVRKDSGHCVIADGLRLALPEARRISVDLATIRFSLDGRRYIFATPRRAQETLLKFDDGAVIEPLQVRLHKPLQVTLTKTTRPNEGPARAERRRQEKRKRKTREIVGGDNRQVPTIIGGTTPPRGALATGYAGQKSTDRLTGRRREYGLRAMATRGV